MVVKKNNSKITKVIDVTEPGKSLPSASSRSIIVSSRPILQQDPMMVPASDEAPEKELKAPSQIKLKIQPLDSDLKIIPEDSTLAVAKEPVVEEKSLPEETEKKAPTADVNQSTVKDPDDIEKPLVEDVEPASGQTSAVEDAAQEKPESLVPDEVEVSDSIKETPNIEPSSKQSDERNSTEVTKDQVEITKKEDDAKAAHQAELEKIIDSQKYFLPINSVEKRRDKHLAIGALIVIVILILVWFDLMLDAGIIKISGIHAVTHFFSS